MMVETDLRESSIEGIGVFVTQDVPRGTLLWKFDSRIDRVFSQEEIDSLPLATASFVRRFSTWHAASGLWIFCGDNGRHFNHSDAPNTFSAGIGFGDDYAAIDLKAGDELTSDYRTICDAARLNGVDFEPVDVSQSSSMPQLSSAA